MTLAGEASNEMVSTWSPLPDYLSSWMNLSLWFCILLGLLGAFSYVWWETRSWQVNVRRAWMDNAHKKPAKALRGYQRALTLDPEIPPLFVHLLISTWRRVLVLAVICFTGASVIFSVVPVVMPWVADYATEVDVPYSSKSLQKWLREEYCLPVSEKEAAGLVRKMHEQSKSSALPPAISGYAHPGTGYVPVGPFYLRPWLGKNEWAVVDGNGELLRQLKDFVPMTPELEAKYGDWKGFCSYMALSREPADEVMDAVRKLRETLWPWQ